jgi:cytochrome c oxidase subunit I+III
VGRAGEPRSACWHSPATLRWVWQTDRPPVAERVEVATGRFVPVGALGRRSHAWWATAILVVVDLTIFASLLFAHLHLSMRAEVCPPPGAALPRDAAIWPALVMLAVGSLAIAFAARTRSNAKPTASAWPMGARWRASAGIGIAIGATAAATSALLIAQQAAGLAPARDAWSASVGALVAWQAFHGVVLALMALYGLARVWSGCLTDRSRATLDAITLFWHGVTVQGLVGLAVVQWLPRWPGLTAEGPPAAPHRQRRFTFKRRVRRR